MTHWWVLSDAQMETLRRGEPVCRVYRRPPGDDPGTFVRAQSQSRSAGRFAGRFDPEQDLYIEVLSRVWRQYGKGRVRPRYEAFVMIRKAPDDEPDVVSMREDDQEAGA